MENKKIYKCDYMDSGINFERYRVHVCCKTTCEGGGMPVLAEKYNDLDWEKVFKQKKEWKNLIAQGTPPEKCKGCSHIVETDELVSEDFIAFVDVNSFINCNSRCIYCDCYENTDFKETSLLPRFQELFDKKLLRNTNYGYIQFAGGEPALMLDFEKIIDLCIENGLERFIVNSNGIKFSKGIERLLSETKTNLCVSLDSGSSQVYEKIKRVPCFDKVVDNLRKYATAQKEGQSLVWSKFIIIPEYNDSEEEINRWYDLSVNLGIKALILDVEREWFMKNNRQINDNIENLISIIQERCEQDNIKLDYYESLKCLYGIH